jgi:hypothetical protein
MAASSGSLVKYGRGEKIRTSDPLHPMQVRYQAALRPDTKGAIIYELLLTTKNLLQIIKQRLKLGLQF